MRETRRNGGAAATSELTPLRAPHMDARLMDNQVAPPGADSPPSPAVLIARGLSGLSDADEARDSVPPIDLEQFAFHRCVRALPVHADALVQRTLTVERRAARSGS
jgi:hypothetical protein